MLRPLKAIRAKCLDCSYGNPNEVRNCPVKECSLYPYRSGHRPKGKWALDVYGQNNTKQEEYNK